MPLFSVKKIGVFNFCESVSRGIPQRNRSPSARRVAAGRSSASPSGCPESCCAISVPVNNPETVISSPKKMVGDLVYVNMQVFAKQGEPVAEAFYKRIGRRAGRDRYFAPPVPKRGDVVRQKIEFQIKF